MTPVQPTSVNILTTRATFEEAWTTFRTFNSTRISTGVPVNKADLIALWLASETVDCPNLSKAWYEARYLLPKLIITD